VFALFIINKCKIDLLVITQHVAGRDWAALGDDDVFRVEEATTNVKVPRP